MRTLGVILVGGEARRLGGVNKVLLDLGGRPVLSLVIDRVKPQVHELCLSVHADPEPYAAFGLSCLCDPDGGRGGPLAGIVAALSCAVSREFAQVLTVSGDAPFLPADLCQRLSGGNDTAAIARSKGRVHPLIGLWPVSALALAEQHLHNGKRRVLDFALALEARVVDFDPDPDPFFDIDTVEDLEAARRRLLQS